MSTELKTLNGYGFDATKLGGLNAQYYAQGRAAHNIMDNSYFIKNAFIAQAGVNGAHGAEKYLGDRWIGHSYIGATEQNDGMVLTSSNQFAYIKQKVNTVVGKTYTFAIYATGISNNHRIDVYDGGMNSSIASNTMNSSNGILLVSFVATTETTCLLYYPGYASSGGSAKIVWAALYEGAYDASTLPAYQPKGYAAELAECQRYYLPLNNQLLGSGYTFTGGATLLVPRKMRIDEPSFVSDGTILARVNGADYPLTLSYVTTFWSMIKVNFASNNIPVNHPCAFYSEATSVSLNADL